MRSSARHPSETTISSTRRPPRVVRHVPRRARLGGVAEFENVGGRPVAEPPQSRLDLAEHIARQAPAKIRLQELVAFVSITEARTVLIELLH